MGSRVSVAGVLGGLFVLVAAAVCIHFGFWQLDRLEQRRAQNAALREALAHPVLTLDPPTAAAIAARPDTFLYRRVRVSGSFRPSGEVVLRGRSLDGRPGVHLFTPLGIEEGTAAVLVNRGWIPAADGATVDPRRFDEPGLSAAEALVYTYPAAEGQGAPAHIEVHGYGVLTLRRLDTLELRRQAGPPLLPFYLQELPDAALRGPPTRLPPPTLDEGPHLSYAVQWFSFAAIFLVGFAVVVLRGRHVGSAPPPGRTRPLDPDSFSSPPPVERPGPVRTV